MAERAGARAGFANTGIFTSDLDAQDWEPLAEVPGSGFHALVESDDYQAGLWRIPGEGNMTFRWSAPARDTFLVLGGEGESRSTTIHPQRETSSMV